MQSNKFFKVEYVKHVRNNIIPTVLLAPVFILVSVFIVIFLMIAAGPLQKNINTILGSDYSYVIESPLQYEEFSSNYKIDNIIPFSNNSGKRINVNTYMTSAANDMSTIVEPDIDLQENEAAISEKIAKELDITTGDTVFIELPIYDEPEQYTIKVITPYIWDYYNYTENVDFSAAYIAYDKDLEQHTIGKYIYFLNENKYNEFFSNDYSYIKAYDIQNELDRSQHMLSVLSVVVLAILIVLTIAFGLQSRKLILREVTKYKKDSFDITFVKIIYILDNILFLILPLAALEIVCAVLAALNYILWMLPIGIVVILLFEILCTEIGGKIFERSA